MPLILKKIENQYLTSLSRGKRQYRRIKGLRNYSAINYKDLIIILATNGSGELDNGFKKFNESLKIEISPYLAIVIHRDERNKLTIRLDRDTYRYFREEFKKSIEKTDWYKYKLLRSRYFNLIKALQWKGVGKQTKELGKMIHSLIKKNRTTRDWKFF